MKDAINFVILLKKVYKAKITRYGTFHLARSKDFTVTTY